MYKLVRFYRLVDYRQKCEVHNIFSGVFLVSSLSIVITGNNNTHHTQLRVTFSDGLSLESTSILSSSKPAASYKQIATTFKQTTTECTSNRWHIPALKY